MAKRPVFVPSRQQGKLVEELLIEFEWHAGMAVSQKQKSIRSLHAAARRKGIDPILEVSTKSSSPLGVRLSSFNLVYESVSGVDWTVESVFQGSKKFERGGPYKDLVGMSGFDIKKDERLVNSGRLEYFEFDDVRWDLEPKTAFYDWLYLHALTRNDDLAREIRTYRGFTDIEFNPQKSINCQARSCALYVFLTEHGTLKHALSDRDLFMKILQGKETGSQLRFSEEST